MGISDRAPDSKMVNRTVSKMFVSSGLSASVSEFLDIPLSHPSTVPIHEKHPYRREQVDMTQFESADTVLW